MKINSYHPFRSSKAREQFLSSYDTLAKKWPVPSETIVIKTSYGTTFVRISGPVDGLPIVLLHGHLENSLNWLPNIEELSQDYRTYAIDTISDPGRSIYTKLLKSSEDFTNWLDEVFDGLGLEQGINLIGLSYGGWLTSQYALRFPHRLGKIILIVPGGIAPFSLRFLLFAILLGMFQFKIKFLFKQLTRWLFFDFLEKDIKNETKFNEWFNFLYLGMQSHKSPPMVFATSLSDEDIQKLTMPTLILVGENEVVYSVKKMLERIQKLEHNIKINVIKNAGHDLTFSQPQSVNLAILDFLKHDKSH